MPWDDVANAELYDRFARTHTLYRSTSRDLSGLAALDTAKLVVDLACGTGVSTEAILERVPGGASVVAIDGSPAMLDIARRQVTDPRVTWVCSTDLVQDVSEADAVLCNSAIWQLDLDKAFASAAEALRPGGRLVFNIGRMMMILPFTPEELEPHDKPGFLDLTQAIAVLDHDYVAPRPARRGMRPLTPDGIGQMLQAAGLVLRDTVRREYAGSAEEHLAWSSVPVFADNVLRGMPHDRQLQVLQQAYARWDKHAPPNAWLTFVAEKP